MASPSAIGADILPTPPTAKKIPEVQTVHGDTRVDNYAWLRDNAWNNGKDAMDPDIIQYLEAENAYTAQILEPLKPLSAEIAQEIKGRINLNDETVPVEDRGYLYYSRLREGCDYWQHWRRRVGAPETDEECILDENALAAEAQIASTVTPPYFNLGAIGYNPEQSMVAFSVDTKGDESYTIRIKDLTAPPPDGDTPAPGGDSGFLLKDVIEGASSQIVWDAEGRGIFYLKLDSNHRANKLYYHSLGTHQNQDILVFQEPNDSYHVSFSQTSDRRGLIISSGNSQSTEAYYLALDGWSEEAPRGGKAPTREPLTILPRQDGVLYDADAADGELYLHINDTGPNFRLIRSPIEGVASPSTKSTWQEVLPHTPNNYLVDFDLARGHLSYTYRENGLNRLFLKNTETADTTAIPLDDEPHVANGYFPTYESTFLRITYSSLKHPVTTIDYDTETGTLTTRKVDALPCGHNPDDYGVERLWAKGKDGTAIPISLLYNKHLTNPKDAPAPVLLYGYGSYGHAVPPRFNKNALSVVNRGILFAIAHIRGGDDMGYEWYEQAKLLTKKRTFEDFIACAEHLIEVGYTRAGDIGIMGGSAGGMLVGSVVNQRPELFRVVAALVPFVDVLTTMLDETLPLTPGEYPEWGNPKEAAYYTYIKSYSPYDTVKNQPYPPMLVTAGLSDPRVTYWEPAKWVAKLREATTGHGPILLKTEMGGGHFGPSGLTEEIKEAADSYAFLIHHLQQQNILPGGQTP